MIIHSVCSLLFLLLQGRKCNDFFPNKDTRLFGCGDKNKIYFISFIYLIGRTKMPPQKTILYHVNKPGSNKMPKKVTWIVIYRFPSDLTSVTFNK